MLAACSAVGSAAAADEPASPAGVYRAQAVPGSPVLTSAGMAWWNGRLILADRAGKSLIAFTPPDKFETIKALTHPVGVAVDAQGNLLVTEKEKGVLNRLVRFKPDGAEETIAEGEAVGSPHFLTVHAGGTIYWSGFPDGGTRSLKPGGKVVVHSPRIVHTYGIALSPKQDWLYVASKIPNKDRRGVWRFPVDRDGVAGEGEFFLQVQALSPELYGLPAPKDGDPTLLGWVGRLQGLAVDKAGNLYIAGAESHTSGEAVAVISPDGKRVIAMILGVPRNISGLAFGGPDRKTLFVTGAGEYRLHQVRLPVAGL
jgi:gluconolactonase